MWWRKREMLKLKVHVCFELFHSLSHCPAGSCTRSAHASRFTTIGPTRSEACPRLNTSLLGLRSMWEEIRDAACISFPPLLVATGLNTIQKASLSNIANKFLEKPSSKINTVRKTGWQPLAMSPSR